MCCIIVHEVMSFIFVLLRIFFLISAPPTTSISPKSPTLSDTIEEADENAPSPSPPPTEKKTKDASPRPPMLPDDVTRSGASSPALSTGYTAHTVV